MRPVDGRRRWARWRDRLRDRPVGEVVYRIVVAVVGVAVLVLGILAIPYPGPGWAIVFIGLGILDTEFRWAQRLLAYSKRHYDNAMTWFRARGPWVRAAGVVFTTAVVLATLWLFGAIGWFAELIGVDSVWLKSPIGVGR